MNATFTAVGLMGPQRRFRGQLTNKEGARAPRTYPEDRAPDGQFGVKSREFCPWPAARISVSYLIVYRYANGGPGAPEAAVLAKVALGGAGGALIALRIGVPPSPEGPASANRANPPGAVPPVQSVMLNSRLRLPLDPGCFRS